MKGLPEDSLSWDHPRKWSSSRYLLITALLVIGAFWTRHVYLVGDRISVHAGHAPPRGPSISPAELAYGRSKCLANQQQPEVDYTLASKRLSSLSDRREKDTKRTILRNATIVDGDGKTVPGQSVIVRDGIIEAVDEDFRLQDLAARSDTVVDVKGRIVTPGLIEMHSHAGVRALPQLWAAEDVTEISSPITPGARAIDGYKSNDMALDLIASGGVTTSLVLTGAQNIMSGEGYVFKMKRHDSPYAMLVNTSATSEQKPQRYLKMALGENIMKTFEHRAGGPVTREGISYQFRLAFEEARLLKREQDHWCENVEEHGYRENPYPESLKTQTLVDLLRGDIRLNVHCYETEDVFSLFDHSDEFGFNVTTVHHAMASHLMIDELLKREVAVATFSDDWGFKPEQYDTSFYLSKALVEAGIPLILTTDHPAGYGKLLTYQAEVAHDNGVDADHAIASIIGVPAKYLGLDNRLGYIRPGFDADLVIWDKHPLRLGATPLLVTINGEVVINATETLWKHQQPESSVRPPPQRKQHESDFSTCSPNQKDLIITGIISDYFTEDNSDMEMKVSEDGTNPTATAVIRDGKLACVGMQRCRSLADEMINVEQIPVMNLTQGFILPVSTTRTVLSISMRPNVISHQGLTMVTRQYGMGEIPYEDSTMDGKVAGDDIDSPVFAKRGLRFGEQHLDRPHRNGVTRLITAPMTDGFFHGVSAAFRTGASSGKAISDIRCLSILLTVLLQPLIRMLFHVRTVVSTSLLAMMENVSQNAGNSKLSYRMLMGTHRNIDTNCLEAITDLERDPDNEEKRSSTVRESWKRRASGGGSD